jgi:hypothetical protein
MNDLQTTLTCTWMIDSVVSCKTNKKITSEKPIKLSASMCKAVCIFVWWIGLKNIVSNMVTRSCGCMRDCRPGVGPVVVAQCGQGRRSVRESGEWRLSGRRHSAERWAGRTAVVAHDTNTIGPSAGAVFEKETATNHNIQLRKTKHKETQTLGLRLRGLVSFLYSTHQATACLHGSRVICVLGAMCVPEAPH